ncbi:hypothetical protein FA95DRAFT_1405476 [Auriscalpium vulgare]|uniref:Uncharacterized protein n=1 Tax=Auriscalpium vulgare TaxID=40419 RepID=A0ACB8RRG7_9AGAM|nr:hypothetical protein FA95DRAFT_1405476 [Auriscalpium vulgare]
MTWRIPALFCHERTRRTSPTFLLASISRHSSSMEYMHAEITSHITSFRLLLTTRLHCLYSQSATSKRSREEPVEQALSMGFAQRGPSVPRCAAGPRSGAASAAQWCSTARLCKLRHPPGREAAPATARRRLLRGWHWQYRLSLHPTVARYSRIQPPSVMFSSASASWAYTQESIELSTALAFHATTISDTALRLRSSRRHCANCPTVDFSTRTGAPRLLDHAYS